jgi:glutamate carboxypeptidase
MNKTINELVPLYQDFLRDISKIETPSENKAQLDKMVDFVEAFAKKRGFDTERIPFEKSGDFLKISVKGTEELPYVMFMAHMDTVHKIGAFGEGIIYEEDGWLHGPGVMDCKGGIASSMLVMEALRAENFKRPTVLLLTSDEEVGGKLSREKGFDIIKSTAKGACAVFNGEPGTEKGITVGRKGIHHIKINVTGKAAHAGNGYFDGASAIKEAANLLLKIEALSSRDKCTFNCGLISGGTVSNAVPPMCEFHIDIRGKTVSDLDEAYEKVLEILKERTVPGTSCEVSTVSRRPPMECTEANMRLLGIVNEAAKKLSQPALEPIFRGGGSDAAYTVIAGTPTVCSCGPVGLFEHSTNEKVLLSSLGPRAELIAEAAKLL